jgi:hypothetical protein
VSLDLGGDARAAATPLVVERQTSFPLPAARAPGRPRELRVVLDRDPPRALDTEIAFDLEPPYALADLAAPDRVHLRGARRSAVEDRSASFAFTVPAPPAPPRRLGLVALATLAALAVALSGAARRVRRRR